MKRRAVLLAAFCVIPYLNRQVAASDSMGITEITLERITPRTQNGEFYKIVLRGDGSAAYAGNRGVQNIGQYQGKSAGFDKLAEWLLKQEILNLNDTYSQGTADAPTTITTIAQNGKRKIITDLDANKAPIQLWGINAAIDGVASRIRWEKDH